MVALGGGVAALVLGIMGIIIWWKEFFIVLAGSIPLMLVLGGALAAYLGMEELKDKKAAEPFESQESKLKEEVETLKKEIEELKKEEKADKPKDKSKDKAK